MTQSKKMNDATPAASIPPKDLDKNTEALGQLLTTLSRSRIEEVLDIRYGLGGWAKESLRQLSSVTRYVAWEADKRTYDLAYDGDDKISLFNDRFTPEMIEAEYTIDLLLADFNLVTLRQKSLALEAAKLGPRYLVFTNVACGKLRLNFRSYGLESADLDQYWKQWEHELPGYELLDYVRARHFASTGLFKKL